MSPVDLSGTELRAWREAHGLFIYGVAQHIGYAASALSMMEHGHVRVAPEVAAYVAAHPAPAADPTYPSTVAGLDAAIVAHWPHRLAWCAWWGCSYMALWHWQRGHAALPLAVRAWLRAGAPRAWRRMTTLPYVESIERASSRPFVTPRPGVEQQARILALLADGPLSRYDLWRRFPVSLSSGGVRHHVQAMVQQGVLERIELPGALPVYRLVRTERSA